MLADLSLPSLGELHGDLDLPLDAVDAPLEHPVFVGESLVEWVLSKQGLFCDRVPCPIGMLGSDIASSYLGGGPKSVIFLGITSLL